MVAIANWAYIEAQLQAAREAEKRLLAAATPVFGAEKAAEIIERARLHGAARIRVENPHMFDTDS